MSFESNKSPESMSFEIDMELVVDDHAFALEFAWSARRASASRAR